MAMYDYMTREERSMYYQLKKLMLPKFSARQKQNRHDWFQRNKERMRDYYQQWRKDNYKQHLEYCRLKRRRYRRLHPEKDRKSHLTTQQYLKKILRQRLRNVFRRAGFVKSTRATIALGCSLEDFKIYLESRFEPGMTWKNYGAVWHIDHIMPCAIFDMTKPEHVKRCFHFSNMQPMFAKENLCKRAKVTSNQFNLL
jgi:hypothetical protein